MSKQRHSHAIRNIDLNQDLLKVVFLLLNLSGANIETLHIIQCCQSEIYNQNISGRCVKSAAFARHELTLKDVEQLWENDNSTGKKHILKACELVSGGREGTITECIQEHFAAIFSDRGGTNKHKSYIWSQCR